MEAAFRFPLCLLAQGGSIKERLNNIMDFAILNDALKISDETLEEIFDEDYHTEITKWDPDNDIHQKMLITVLRKGLVINDCFIVFDIYKAMSEFIENFERRFGKDMWTRFGAQLTWDTYNEIFEYELFAIICAINGILGTKAAYKRITLNRIRAAMNGYKKYQIYEEFCKSGKLPNNNLSEINDRTLYRRLDKLGELNFFRRYTYKNRHTYYSTRIDSIDELVHTVCKAISNRMRERKIIDSIEQTYGLSD